jgi:hypothetical protein
MFKNEKPLVKVRDDSMADKQVRGNCRRAAGQKIKDEDGETGWLL